MLKSWNDNWLSPIRSLVKGVLMANEYKPWEEEDTSEAEFYKKLYLEEVKMVKTLSIYARHKTGCVESYNLEPYHMLGCSCGWFKLREQLMEEGNGPIEGHESGSESPS